jgi:hypothetical protein
VAPPPVVSRAVEPLVMEGGGIREPGQEWRGSKDALGAIRVQPHLPPVVRRQRPGLLPDPDWDGDPPYVVHERGASDRPDVGSSAPHVLAAADASPATPRE